MIKFFKHHTYERDRRNEERASRVASIVKVKDKRSGLTYAYHSESYWDKEKKAPRNRRTLIGRVDETTGEIVPTDGRRRKNMANQEDMNARQDADVHTTDFDKAEYTKKLDEMISAAQQLCDGLKALRKLVQ